MDDGELHSMLRAHGVKITEIVAWTRGYRPFVMGGSTRYLLAARIPCEPPVHLGKGFYGCLVRSPDGTITRVIEPLSGACVGPNIDTVIADVMLCEDDGSMRKQIEDAIAEKERKGLSMVSPEEWWTKQKKAQERVDNG